MKQPDPQRWAVYMRECAERCRRQLAAAQVRADARPRVAAVQAVCLPLYDYLPGHERPLEWFETVVRRGCADE